MQRVVPGLARPALALAGAGAGAATSVHVRAPTGPLSPETSHKVSVVEDDDGWGYVQFRREEVSDVITSLTSRPRITELVSDDGSTTDGEADRAFHRAEPYHGDETVNNVTTVVTNLLNDPVAGAAVQQALFNDPTFRSMVRQETGACLPPPAARPLLTGPERSAPGDDANLFAAVGSALEAILSKLANSCVALGSVLRRLPEDLRTVLRRGRSTGGGVPSLDGQLTEGGRTYEDALMGVCLAVAVLVLARRRVRFG